FYLTPFLHYGSPGDTSDPVYRQYTQRPLRWLLQQADGVFVQTETEADIVRHLGVFPEHVHHQGLGVDPAECTGGNREAARGRWGAAASDFVVGHLANLSQEKGSVDLLAAVQPLLSTRNLKLVLAGESMPNFRQARKTWPSTPTILELGPLTDSAKQDFYAGIDAFVLPSRSDSFGLVLLEAWANRLPVLVYRLGGPGALVRDGVDGRSVPPEVPALTRVLQQWQLDRPLARELGLAGQRRTFVEFRWDDKLRLVRETIREAVLKNQLLRGNPPGDQTE
ncbi:MAG: glycosyltransferase family 4 protein, partial [Gemmataceae bacterium]